MAQTTDSFGCHRGPFTDGGSWIRVRAGIAKACPAWAPLLAAVLAVSCWCGQGLAQGRRDRASQPVVTPQGSLSPTPVISLRPNLTVTALSQPGTRISLPRAAANPQATAAGSSVAALSDEELQIADDAWHAIERTRDPAVVEDYLRRFPEGPPADRAQQQLEVLRKADRIRNLQQQIKIVEAAQHSVAPGEHAPGADTARP